MILLCAAGLAVGSYTDTELKHQFEAKIEACVSFYQRKGYTVPEKDDESALQLFINAYHAVNQHNSNPTRSYNQVLNCFATVNYVSKPFIIPPEIEEPIALLVNASTGIIPPQVGNTGTSPDSYDRRDDNTTTPVKDQGSCNSCWAFTSIACLETKYLELTGDNPADVDFSEQQMVDCAYEALAVTARGCEGGWVRKAWLDLKKFQLNIMNSEDQRPYTGADVVCDIKELNKPNAMAKAKVIGVYQNTKGEIHQSSDSHKPRPNTMPRYSRIESRPT